MWRSVDELGLRFRASDLTPLDVVVEVSLRVHAGDPRAAEAEIAEIVRWRRENQPGGQNAGSVFVNPVPGEVSAGLLIDGLGLRGLRVGTAWVSEKHANFIQASADGSAHDVRALIDLVRARVAEATGDRTAQRGPTRRIRGRAVSDSPSITRRRHHLGGRRPAIGGARRVARRLRRTACPRVSRGRSRRRSSPSRWFRRRLVDRSVALDVKRSVRPSTKRNELRRSPRRPSGRPRRSARRPRRRRRGSLILNLNPKSTSRSWRMTKTWGFEFFQGRPRRASRSLTRDCPTRFTSKVIWARAAAPRCGRHRALISGRRCSSTTAARAPARLSRSTSPPRRRGWSRACASGASLSNEPSGASASSGSPSEEPSRRSSSPCSAVLGSGLFAISTVEVEGAVYSQGDALDAVVDELEGANVLRVDTAAAERALEAIPWVDDARVTTDFPHGAKIEVRERRPMVAYLAADGRYRVLDAEWSGARRDRRTPGRLSRTRRRRWPRAGSRAAGASGLSRCGNARFGADATDATARFCPCRSIRMQRNCR